MRICEILRSALEERGIDVDNRELFATARMLKQTLREQGRRAFIAELRQEIRRLERLTLC